MGDQRRRNKSRGCQKEQEEDEEEVCGRVYTEWLWHLLTVHPGEREGGRKGGEAETRTREMEGGGEQMRWSKEKMKGANER